MQTEKVAKTNGENKNFEGRMFAKSEIVKKRLYYIAFLTTTNRRVRQTIGNVMRAQRCKIKEIGPKQELLKKRSKYIGFLAGRRQNSGKRNV